MRDDGAWPGEDVVAYLRTQRLGRLATRRSDGSLQVSPVGFRLNANLRTIDIGGLRMARTQKFRNVAATGVVAFVVDDLASVDPWVVRGVEFRGTAEALAVPEGSAIRLGDGAIIRIHPQRTLVWGI